MTQKKAASGKGRQNRTVMKRVLRYVRAHLRYVLLSLLLAFLITGFSLYLPILQGRAVDTLLGKGKVDLPSLLQVILIFGCFTAAASLLQWLQNIIHNRITYRIVETLRQDAFRKIQRLPLSYLDAHPVGDLVSRISTDADQFSEGLLMGFTQLFTGILTILGTFFFMLSIHPLMALLVALLTPISLFVSRFIARRTFKYFQEQSHLRGQQTAFMEEQLSGLRTVQAYTAQPASCAAFDILNEKLHKSSRLSVFFSSLTNPVTRFVNSLIYAASALLSAVLVLRGHMSIGQLTSILSYANQYTKPFNEISGVIAELQNSIACAGRLLELIDLPEESPETDKKALPSPLQGAVAFWDVDFSYDPSRPLLQDLSFEAKPGQKIAIVGPTGCGKTTLINLIMRFYDIDRGQITADGQSIYDVPRASLRHEIGMVLQDTWIKHSTVHDNICLGRPGASREEVIRAARAAYADSFIRRLPQGYDTVLTGSDELSAGEKQLICIARVMLDLPPILILDEATSSIDTRTEMLISRSFDALTKGRTSFVVAHRLSTILTADLILVMKDGSVIERGTHRELLQQKGFYYELYHAQYAKEKENAASS